MTEINNIPASSVDQAEQQLVQILKDEYPSMDLSRGRVLRELLIRPAAIFHAMNEQNLDALRRSFSLQQISQNPTLASDDIVDGVLANLLIERDTGEVSSGQLRIIISQKAVTPIAAGAIFTSNGLSFRATRAFVGVTSQTNIVNTGSRLITSHADGLYEFVIDVEAAETGDQYNLAEGARFTSSAAIPRLVDIVAASDFSGGRTTEDNAALAARAQSGLSPRVLSGRSHIEALLFDTFDYIRDVSIIGYGDSEMERDAHNMFGISYGGKVDIYPQTATAPQRELVSVIATMTDPTTKTLTVTLDRNQMAGAYAVLAVYRHADTPYVLNSNSEPSLIDGLEISSTTWMYNVTQTGDEFVPDITSAEEAAFTRYCTAQLKFVDEESTLNIGQNDTYKVYVLKMPYIDELQDFVNERSRRSPGADYLVRAPIPAICTLGVQIRSRNTNEIDTAAIKTAIANAVNALGFSVGHLPGSVIIDAAQGQIPSDAVLDLPVTMLAKLYLPDGTTKVITGTDELRVPDTDLPTVSGRTVLWSARTNDIDVVVDEITTPSI